MMVSFSPFVFLTLLLSSQLLTITGQLLTTEYLRVRLPYVESCITPHYDGEDSIFLFGGCRLVAYNSILKFSISSETLENVGTLPGYAVRGTAQSDNSGNIFYLGGRGYRDIYKFDPTTNTATNVSIFPYDVQDSISIKYNSTSDTVYILGGDGQGHDLLSFNMATLTISTVLTNLPLRANQGTSVQVGNKAYVFTDEHPNDNRMALELNLDTFHFQPVGPSTLPVFNRHPASIWDGNYAYVIGGYYPSTGTPPTGGLIRFDPRTFENDFIHVRNFPVKGTSYFSAAPASIFVPGNNRIYFFGGESLSTVNSSRVTHDEIFYIDLTPLGEPTPSSSTNSDIFTCTNLPDGHHPHPIDGSLFIRCQNEEMTIFSCSPPFLFDPDKRNCEFPDSVICLDKS